MSEDNTMLANEISFVVLKSFNLHRPFLHHVKDFVLRMSLRYLLIAFSSLPTLDMSLAWLWLCARASGSSCSRRWLPNMDR